MKYPRKLINHGWDNSRGSYEIHQLDSCGRTDVIYGGRPAYSGTCFRLYPIRVLNRSALILSGALVSVYDVDPEKIKA